VKKTRRTQCVSWIKKALPEFRNEFTSNQIISTFILAWIRKKDIDAYELTYTHECKIYQQYYNEGLYNRICTWFESISLKDLESIFENLIDLDRKKSEGAVYTPDYIIDFIIKKSLSLYKKDKPPLLCDPCCGSGGFLVRAIDIYSRQFNLDAKCVFLKYIRGIDVNPQAVSCAKIITELYFLDKRIKPPILERNIICSDTLLSTKKELTSRVGCSEEGVDLIVTNPPYVKLQNIDRRYRKKLVKVYAQYVKGSFSLAMLFLIAGHKFLSAKGVLGYITQNNIYTSLAGENVRKYVVENNCLHTIIDFGHERIFHNASAYTCLVFLTRDKNQELLFNSCFQPEEKLYDLRAEDFSPIPIRTLNSKKWRLAPLKHLKNLRRLETKGTPLCKLAEIKVGFATLKDSVFFVNGHRAVSDIEYEITRPAIKVAHLTDQESVANKIARIIHPYKKSAGRWIPLEPDEFRGKFPKAYRYLEKKKEILLKRDKGKKHYKYFYEWGRTQCMDAPGPKLLTKTFNKGPGFLLDESDSLFCNGYSVKPVCQGNLFCQSLPIDILQKILNSIVMDYFTKLTSFQIDGNYQCFQKNFIENFCIVPLNDTALTEIRRNHGVHLDKLICELFDLRYEDLLEITLR